MFYNNLIFEGESIKYLELFLCFMYIYNGKENFTNDY